MSAMFNASISPAMFAGQNCGKRMPFFMHPACIPTTASIIIPETGADTPVFLVARMLSFILVLFDVLLTLIGLTRLENLVGLIPGQHHSTAQGD